MSKVCQETRIEESAMLGCYTPSDPGLQFSLKSSSAGYEHHIYEHHDKEANPLANIIQEFTVKAPPDRVFQAMATPEGLARWWTKSSEGKSEEGAEYSLFFGQEYDWRGRVTRYKPHSTFELEITKAHPDWIGTRVGCDLQAEGTDSTRVRFYHTGWPTENEHWRVSCYCWPMYLRVMRRNLEHGETVPYENRLDA